MTTITVAKAVEISNAPQSLVSTLKARLSFENPQFLKNERGGFSNYQTERYIHGYKLQGDTMIIPRGFIHQLLSLLKSSGISYQLEDLRRVLPDVEFQFLCQLKDFQEEAVDNIIGKSFGVLDAPTGAGKTIMALAVVAARKQPALIIVHTRELQAQWVDRISTFLGIDKNEIGQIGGGKHTIRNITVGIVNSVVLCADELKKHFGFVICDECHRCPSKTFTDAVSSFDSKFMLGLSATPYRRDGLSRLIWWSLGDLVHSVDRASLVSGGDILQADVITRETDFSTYLDPSEQYSKMLSELTEDHKRNSLIVSDVVHEANECSGICLVLSDRRTHCETLQRLLAGHGIKTALLTGALVKKERERIVDALNQGEVKVLVATGQLIGEGFDCKGLSTLFLATPIKFDGRLLQYLGRVLRPAPGKDRARVYDYIDVHVGVLANAAKCRARAFAKVECGVAA